jgi:elongation factor 3
MSGVKVAAQTAAEAIVSAANPNAVKAIIPHLSHSLETAQKWPEKMTDLKCIEILTTSAPAQMAFRVPDLIPVISGAMWDTKAEVKKAAYATMETLCSLISNKDIERFIPELIKCIAKPENVPETVHLLGATTFVTDVHEPTLAIMVPLLERGLVERETAIKRKTAVIIDNMCKLVEDPQIVAAFLPKLMPALEKNHDNLADPEAREKTRQALDTLIRVGAVKDGKIPELERFGDIATVAGNLKAVLPSKYKINEKFTPVVEYIGAIGGQLIDEKDYEGINWQANAGPFVAVLVGDEEAKDITENLRKKSLPPSAAEDVAEPDEEEGEDLCNCLRC